MIIGAEDFPSYLTCDVLNLKQNYTQSILNKGP